MIRIYVLIKGYKDRVKDIKRLTSSYTIEDGEELLKHAYDYIEYFKGDGIDKNGLQISFNDWYKI